MKKKEKATRRDDGICIWQISENHLKMKCVLDCLLYLRALTIIIAIYRYDYRCSKFQTSIGEREAPTKTHTKMKGVNYVCVVLC